MAQDASISGSFCFTDAAKGLGVSVKPPLLMRLFCRASYVGLASLYTEL